MAAWLRHTGNRAVTEGVERRLHHRRPSNLSARAVFNDQSPALDCTVQNVSASGAKIAFAAAVELPREFVLDVPSLDLRVKVRVVWSQAECHGITFVWPQGTVWT